MYRIDNGTAATALPTPTAVGPNPNGYFTVGNPATPTPATVVDADWLNAVQEEVCNVVTGAGLTLSKTSRTQLWAAIQAAASGAVSGFATVVALNAETTRAVGVEATKLGFHVQAFTASGNFTVPAGVTEASVEIWGGGGGSGAVNGSTFGYGTGGGGGGYARKLITGLSPGAVIPVTVGAGGTGAIAGGAAATGGGTSSFGTYCSATGGTPGTSNGQTGGTTIGVGGTGVSGDLNLTGGNGGGASANGTPAGSWFAAAPGVAPLMPAAQPSTGGIPAANGANYGCAGLPAITQAGASLNGGSASAGLVIVRW